MRYILLLLTFCLLGIGIPEAKAQSDNDQHQQIIQFSGVILEQGTERGLNGVHVFVPSTGRGTTSNAYGYFTMPVLAGDSIIVSSLNHTNRALIIPKDRQSNISIAMHLEPDVLVLPNVDVLPFATEEDAKDAIAEMRFPDQQANRVVMGNVNRESAVMWNRQSNLSATPMDNYQQSVNQHFNQYQGFSIPLLNNGTWKQFIKSIKGE